MRASPLLIAIPTYNECENVGPLARKIMAQNLPADILFVDDNSPDGTGKRLDEIASEFDQVTVIHREGKQGIGSAHKIAINYAYENGYDCLITMDSDFTHMPEDLPKFWANRDNADVTIGSRFIVKGSLPGWSLHRILMTIGGHILTRFSLGFNYDANGALRLYNLKRVPQEVFSLVQSNSYDFFLESLFILHLNKFTIQEVGIKLPARAFGSSKMEVKDALRSIRRCLRIGREARKSKERFLLKGSL